MFEQGRVTRMRRLLNAAEPSNEERAPLVQGVGPESQRRLQLLEIRALVSTHWLRPVMEEYLAREDCADLSSLSRGQLQELTARLRKAAERVELLCDHDAAPPAR